jgi:hypothetical protein
MGTVQSSDLPPHTYSSRRQQQPKPVLQTQVLQPVRVQALFGLPFSLFSPPFFHFCILSKTA